MALGRGLGELLGEVEIAYENSTSGTNQGIEKIDVSLIKPNPNQPRKIFDEEKLHELSESIKNMVFFSQLLLLKIKMVRLL